MRRLFLLLLLSLFRYRAESSIAQRECLATELVIRLYLLHAHNKTVLSSWCCPVHATGGGGALKHAP